MQKRAKTFNWAAVVLPFMVFSCGCTTTYVAEIDNRTLGLRTVTMSDEVISDGKPLDAEPLFLISVDKWGLRIFGVIPVGSATLRDAMKPFAEEAKHLSVDAIVHLRFETYKASFPWCLLNWYTSTTVSGMGVKLAGAPETRAADKK